MILSIWSQEFDKNKLDLVKQNGFYPYEYRTDFEKFNERLPSKEKFYSSLTSKKINDNKYEHLFNVWNKFKMNTMKDYHDFYLKCDVLLLPDVFENLEIIASKVMDHVQVMIHNLIHDPWSKSSFANHAVLIFSQ